MRHTVQLIVGSALFLSLPACFADTPAEPRQPPAEVSPTLSVASTTVGNITDLGTFGGFRAGAAALNNHGEIVGTISTSVGDAHGFLWRSGTG
jgi:probable HAF family extracellular repeat protein